MSPSSISIRPLSAFSSLMMCAFSSSRTFWIFLVKLFSTSFGVNEESRPSKPATSFKLARCYDADRSCINLMYREDVLGGRENHKIILDFILLRMRQGGKVDREGSAAYCIGAELQEKPVNKDGIRGRFGKACWKNVGSFFRGSPYCRILGLRSHNVVRWWYLDVATVSNRKCGLWMTLASRPVCSPPFPQ